MIDRYDRARNINFEIELYKGGTEAEEIKTKIDFNNFTIGVYNVEVKFTIDSINFLHKTNIYIQ